MPRQASKRSCTAVTAAGRRRHAGGRWLTGRVVACLLAAAARQCSSNSPPPPPAPRIAGDAVVVFNYSVTTCGAGGHDNVDSPARAFVDAAGTVHLTASAHTARFATGASLYGVRHNCTPVHNSTLNADPAAFADFEWVHATYAPPAPPGTTLGDGGGADVVYGLFHDEYHGRDLGNCTPDVIGKRGFCQLFALTGAVSRDGGYTWAHLLPPPAHLVAAVPHRYVNDSSSMWFGWGDPGGIVRSPIDGFYYTTGHNRASVGAQANGTCLMRTADLAAPRSWRGWDGAAFTVQFANPYNSSDGYRRESVADGGTDSHGNAADAAAGGGGGSGSDGGRVLSPPPHVCAVLEDPVTPGRGGLPRGTYSQSTVVQGLVWSTHLGAFVAVLWNTRHDPLVAGGAPFCYATSSDLVNWTAPTALPLPAGLPNGTLAYPSLLDPDAPARGSRSFDTIGATASLYFGLANPAGTTLAHHWDALLRVPLEWA